MSLLTIRHLPDTFRRDFGCIYDDQERLEFVRTEFKNNQFVRVADIEFVSSVKNQLDAAFELTNSIDVPWYENGCIQVSDEARKGCRSTSVGDIIQKDGKSFMVAGAGFLEI